MKRPLGLVSAVDESFQSADALRLALHEGIRRVGGVGGLVHLLRRVDEQGLYLAVSSGLPPTVTRQWQEVPEGATSPPATAMRRCKPQWALAPVGPGAGLVSVPLPGPDGKSLGALTVVMVGDEPTPGQWDVLRGWPLAPPTSCARTGRDLVRSRTWQVPG